MPRAKSAITDRKDLDDVNKLITLLRVGDRGDRRFAAHRLGRLKAAEAGDELLRAMDDDDRGMRQTVMHALGHIGERRAVRPLIERLSDENAGDRKSAAAALGDIGDARATPALVQALSQRRTRDVAYVALANIDDPAAELPVTHAVPPRWALMTRHLRQAALTTIARRKAAQAGRPFEPLVPVVRDAVLGLVEVWLESLLMIWLAVGVFDADPRTLALVAAVTLLVTLPVSVYRKPSSIPKRIDEARPLQHADIQVESWVRAFRGRAGSLLVGVVLETVLAALGAAFGVVAIVAGIRLGLPDPYAGVGRTIWLVRRQRRTGSRFLRERVTEDSADDRFWVS